MNVYLIDGNSYVYRAFYAVRGLSDSKGRPTNAMFGFTNTLLKIIRERKPDGIAVSFDSPQPTERHILFERYKAHRPEIPDDLRQQLPHIRKIIEAFRIRIFMMPGYEADDILATLAERVSKEGHNVFIVTSDKDMLQLIGDSVKVYDAVGDRVLDEKYVIEKFGVPPSRVVEFMALAGDAADGIPGIKGIGEKTAKELLREMSLDEIIARPELIKKDRLGRLIAENRDMLELSRKLAEINKAVPLDAKAQDLSLKEPDWQALLSIFREFELSSFMKYIPGGPPPVRDYETVFSPDALRAHLSGIKTGFSLYAEAASRDPLRDGIVGFSICPEKGRAFYVPLGHEYEGVPTQMDKKTALEALSPLLEDEEAPKTGHNLKYDILVFGAEGLEVKGRLFDTMVASYLLNPLMADHAIENVCLEYLSRKKRTFAEIAGKGGFQNVGIGDASEFACDDAELAFELKEILFERIAAEGLDGVYFDMEMPLIYVLAGMEEAGVKIDARRLEALSAELDGELESLKKRIYFLAGLEFNINSPKQLGRVLFDVLGLKPGKRKKTGYSTDVSVLEELAKGHELPREVLEWRSIFKLKTTYVDVLPALVNPRTGRLHTSFNQTVTATGRLSSSEPNLQNIPIRGLWGGRIREAFIAEEGNVLVSADYSQIELRIMAHLSGDAGLTESFLRDVDVHARTASELFDVPVSAVTPDMRRAAKAVNFGVIYGITPFGLAEALGISKEEAQKYIEGYFTKHPGIKAYIESAVGEARAKGYVKTLYGRIRPVAELKSATASIRQFGERLAVNSPVQGTAADIIKIAMINLSKALMPISKSGGRWPAAILQVHDELVVEAPEEIAAEVMGIMREAMEGAASLSVPLKVDVRCGKNWGKA